MKVEGSSHIARIHYSEGALFVQFHTGAVYRYDNVPPEKWDGLVAAKSKGVYLNAEIKPHHHVFRESEWRFD